ncbi:MULTISPECIES: class I SAM-dependent methyltransferase [Lactococcus]|uniref:class I SAM-dependent methyltransferase n=1 Tax=Lactococcus TaxID=1357 RepID=UPI00203A8EAB|nr:MULTISPECIES: class I SAM-dependent methyltransferase [Lactococcus]
MFRPIEMSHHMLAEIIKADDVVIDATMGNGWDTSFLAALTSNVYAFDIQQEALYSTKKLLQMKGLQAKLILDGHENIDKYVSEPVKAAIFNLGYLPRADKSIITRPNTTLKALEILKEKLLPQGRIMLVIYYGHEGGEEEKAAVIDWVSTLPQSDWQVMRYEPLNQIHKPPFLVCIEKI